MSVTFRSDCEVELINHVGTDEDVIRAARVSVQGRNDIDTREVRGLIDHMMRNRHGSVFEHGSFTFRIYAPIFVHREFVTHRTISKNTESARYREMEPVFYLPDPNRKLRQIGKASAYQLIDGSPEDLANVREEMTAVYQMAYSSYVTMLRAGIAREVARDVLPVGTYTAWYATMNARALMNFLSLRIDHPDNRTPTHPLAEIQEVAVKMGDAFLDRMPATAWSWHVNGRVAP